MSVLIVPANSTDIYQLEQQNHALYVAEIHNYIILVFILLMSDTQVIVV